MIELDRLTKRFGSFTAVDDLSLTVETGEFFGLLGPNGAGKTTTISMTSTVLLPTSASAFAAAPSSRPALSLRMAPKHTSRSGICE